MDIPKTREDFISLHGYLWEIERAASEVRSGEERVTLENFYLKEVKPLTTWGVALVFATRQSKRPLFREKISLNDEVVVEADLPKLDYFSSAPSSATGIVQEITAATLTILVSEDHELNLKADSYTLQKEPDGVSYDRIRRTLNKLAIPSPSGSDYDLDRLFFHESPLPPVRKPKEIVFKNPNLDNSQKEAVKFALAQDKVCMIFGPPGTGKTTTIIEILRQLRNENKRVLICAPSNIALDNIMEQLADLKYDGMMRLGHPGRADPKLLRLMLASIQDRRFNKKSGSRNYFKKSVKRNFKPWTKSESEKLLEEKVEKIKKQRQTFTASFGANFRTDQAAAHGKNYISLYAQRMTSLFLEYSFIFSTLVSASPEGPLGYLVDGAKVKFDVIIIDECSQALEVACWIPLPLAKKVIFVGDPKQLPPTIMCKDSEMKPLELSIMERLELSGKFENYSQLLRTQYRMHQDIMEWPSKQFYRGLLEAHSSVRNSKMSEISKLKNFPALLLIDTIHCRMHEIESEDDLSCGNDHECAIAANLVKSFIQNGVKPNDIGVITPYKLQVKLIRNALGNPSAPIIKTVDGFQGREREVIVLSMVRSNEMGDVGFLKDMRRINVAITRAKKNLTVICDSATVSKHPVLATLISFMYSRGKVIAFKNYRNPDHSTDVNFEGLNQIFTQLSLTAG